MPGSSIQGEHNDDAERIRLYNQTGGTTSAKSRKIDSSPTTEPTLGTSHLRRTQQNQYPSRLSSFLPIRDEKTAHGASAAVQPAAAAARRGSPTFPSSMRSGIPPAFAPTTGTPLAIDSSTTNPSVSESEGITNTSADAKAWLNASPVMTPVITVLVPLKCSWRASASGPVPTNARRALGFLLMDRRQPPTRWANPIELGDCFDFVGRSLGWEVVEGVWLQVRHRVQAWNRRPSMVLVC